MFLRRHHPFGTAPIAVNPPMDIAARRIWEALAAFALSALLLLSFSAAHAQAQDPAPAPAAVQAAIRKGLTERMPNLPKIEEISVTPIAGLFELRLDGELLYTDAQGHYVIQGTVFDTRTKVNLTEQREQKINAVDFASLPLADAIVVKQGTGARKLAVFADPNCGFCKRFERDLLAVKDVTIYTFLYPILGPDSVEKSKAIWCAADRSAVWRAWMLDGKAPARLMGKCDSAALDRNSAFGKKHRLTGTPAILFPDGTRVPGAISAQRVEDGLKEAAAKSGAKS